MILKWFQSKIYLQITWKWPDDMMFIKVAMQKENAKEVVEKRNCKSDWKKWLQKWLKKKQFEKDIAKKAIAKSHCKKWL